MDDLCDENTFGLAHLHEGMLTSYVFSNKE